MTKKLSAWPYEHRSQPVISRNTFLQRIFAHAALSAVIILGSLFIGVLGYRFLESPPLSWVDSLLNASMILGGMGPVTPLQSNPAKIFASAYALFAGMIFLVTIGILIAPIAHRILHSLHLADKE